MVKVVKLISQQVSKEHKQLLEEDDLTPICKKTTTPPQKVEGEEVPPVVGQDAQRDFVEVVVEAPILVEEDQPTQGLINHPPQHTNKVQ